MKYLIGIILGTFIIIITCVLTLVVCLWEFNLKFISNFDTVLDYLWECKWVSKFMEFTDYCLTSPKD